MGRTPTTAPRTTTSRTLLIGKKGNPDPMQDPEHQGRGFYDPQDVESVIRAIRRDHGERLFNADQVAQGKLPATAQVERDLHRRILLKHDHGQPFADVAELHAFIRAYTPEDDAQETMQQLMLSRLGIG